MARKPIRIVKGTSGAPAGDQVYKGQGAADDDRMRITHRVLEYPEPRVRRQDYPDADFRYQELLQCIYDAAFFTDLNGRISGVNGRAEGHFCAKAEDLCRLNIIQLISGADTTLLDVVHRNVDRRRYTMIEAVCRRMSGDKFPAEIVVNRLERPGPDILCFFIRDITARKQAEVDLESANRKLVEAEKIQARMDTISTLLYEVNNPLQVLMSLAELDDNKEYKKQIGRIIDTLNRLRTGEMLETVVDENGGTRYKVAETPKLKPIDASRILIADDEVMVRRVFSGALKKALPNLVIDEAENGKQAVSLFERHHPGLVILDVVMPEMTGEEAFKIIRSRCDEKHWQLPPCIFCTGFEVTPSLKALIGDSDMHVCLTKPLGIGDLIKTVIDKLSDVTRA